MNSTPHIIHLIQSFQIGGLERLALTLAHESQKRGLRSTIIAYESDGPIRHMAQALGINAIYHPKPAGLRPGFAATLMWALNTSGTTMIHAHHLGPLIYAAPARTILGKPILYTDHSHEWCTSRRKYMFGRTMPYTATLTCVSKEIASWHKQTFGHTVEVIPNGVALPTKDHHQRREDRQHHGWKKTDVVVGCVARMASEKNIPTLIRAINMCPPHIKLALVGDGPQRAKIEALVAQLNLQERVRFFGQREDVERFYNTFDMMALTSTREGLPMALLEGMSHSLPFVATNVGEIPELLQHGVGKGVQVNDVSGTSQAIIDYANEPAQRLVDGARARMTIRNHYSVDRMMTQYMNHYQHIIETRRAS